MQIFQFKNVYAVVTAFFTSSFRQLYIKPKARVSELNTKMETSINAEKSVTIIYTKRRNQDNPTLISTAISAVSASSPNTVHFVHMSKVTHFLYRY